MLDADLLEHRSHESCERISIILIAKRIMRILLILSLTFIACTTYGQTFEELTTSAIKAGNEEHYREAIDLYNRALKLNSGNYFIYNKLSLMYFYLGDIDSAILYCDMTLKIVPNDTTALYQRGHCYLEKKGFQKALDDFTLSFATTGKRNSNASYNIGKCYFGLGNIDKAIAFYRTTLALEPNDKYSFYEIGYCYTSLPTRAKDSALQYYTKAIDLDNNYYDPYFNRGLLYATQFKDLVKGHADLERSIAIKPKAKLPYYYNGILYRDEDNLDKAKEMFNKVIELYPNYAEAYYDRAITWYKIGVLNMVCKDLEKADSLGYSKATEARKQLCN
jgi:tetratricopeptide (TPR) repeat protein